MDATYRLSWEMYQEGSWHRVTRRARDPWPQYRRLREWADRDGSVRNVVIEECASSPEWVALSGE